jgi:phosphatidylinositol alpha-1,6-mannosyltransferase
MLSLLLDVHIGLKYGHSLKYKMKLSYLALKIFSAKGGIEQVNKNWLFALHEISKNKKISYRVYSMYDDKHDEQYIRKGLFNAFHANKLLFALKSIWGNINSDIVIISHLNLSLFALIAKLINPRIKIIIQLHGIEAWRLLSGIQELLLEKADQLLAVSNHTANMMIDKYPKYQQKIKVFNNSLDPFIEQTINTSNQARTIAREQLNIPDKQFVLLTIGRLDSSESYKGYDKTLEALSMIKYFDFLFYIIGKYDPKEEQRVRTLIEYYQLTEKVILKGFVMDNELANFYRSADVFIMPSKGEGFGLVFIDSMAHGLRVIGGNVDGSADAISSFKESILVNPDNTNDIKNAIQKMIDIEWTENNRTELSNRCIELFSAKKFQCKIEPLLN